MATKECVACAEEILEKAQLCKHCGTLQSDDRFVNRSPEAVPTSPELAPASRSVDAQSGKACWRCGEQVSAEKKTCDKCGALIPWAPGSDQDLDDYSPPVKMKPAATLGTPGIAIAAIICAFFVPVLGLILGYAARSEIQQSRGRKAGSGLAAASIVLGWLWIVLIVIWVIVASVAAQHLASEISNLGTN